MKNFWRDALVRAVKTFCQAVVTLVGTDAINIIDINWPQILGVACTMTLMSLLTSIATGLPETNYRNELESLNTLDNERLYEVK